MESLVAIGLLPVLMIGRLLRRFAGRRLAPYALLLSGIALCALNYDEQGGRLLLSSLVLGAGLVWAMTRHGY